MTSPAQSDQPLAYFSGGVEPAFTASAQLTRSWLSAIGTHLSPSHHPQDNATTYSFPRLPETSQQRRDASLIEPTSSAQPFTQSDLATASEKQKSVLYLAYGSNLCSETFRGVRGIRPLSQINVLVPSLRLTFDLPGFPYKEPCFANTAMRDPNPATADYHKDKWHKGLVGCVYEVTVSDYAHIIATEGGGAGYQDIVVDCYPLPGGDTVPEIPPTNRFIAHTLYAPIDRAHSRPDPSYAQPSARYLNLITTGATELALPIEYQAYLKDIRTYTITTPKQEMGQRVFLGIWYPFIMMILKLNEKFQDDQGRSPPWLANLASLIFISMWMCYDAVFKRNFGDGERTEGDEALGTYDDHYKEVKGILRVIEERDEGLV